MSTSVVSNRPAIDAAFCSAARVTLAGSMTPAFTQVLVLAGRGVEADRAGLALDVLDDEGTLGSGVVGDEPSGSLERGPHGAGASGLIAFEGRDERGNRSAGAEQCDPATGDDTLLDGRTCGRERVLDAVLLLLELDLGGRADLHDRDAAGELGQALLELLAIPVGVGVLDLTP